MPNMKVYRVEDIDLDVTVFEAKDTPQETHFNIESKLLPVSELWNEQLKIIFSAAKKNLESTIRIAPNSCRTIPNAGHSITQTNFSIGEYCVQNSIIK